MKPVSREEPRGWDRGVTHELKTRMHGPEPGHRSRRYTFIFIMIPANDNIIFFLDLAFTYKSLQALFSGKLRGMWTAREAAFDPALEIKRGAVNLDFQV
jgi:hypothetical protein